jgi:putative flavoprotein involved in K+ transport
MPYDGDQRNGFFTRDELVAWFERYVRERNIRVHERSPVSRVEIDGDAGFRVTAGGKPVRAKNVVVAAGIMNVPKLPAVTKRIPESVTQIHTADYRNPHQLPDGAVLVVGSAQSGCQIVEDLLHHGRRVYLSTSKVGRIVRFYRGRDILEWWKDMGFLDVAVEDLEDQSIRFNAQPQVSGTGGGHTVSLQMLAARGTTLLGRLRDERDGLLVFEPDLQEHVVFADQVSNRFKKSIDDYILKNGIPAPGATDDPAEMAPGPAETAPALLDLAAAGVTAIVWCTGFGADFSWLEAPVLDEQGRPVHQRGVSNVPGIFFLGFPWLHTRKSGLIYGIDEDAAYLADRISERT